MLLVKHHTVNFQTVDFLDVTFNLDKNVYKPFRKENNKPNINVHSNQPRSALRQLPKSLKKQVSETSPDKSIFDKPVKTYKDALNERRIKSYPT